MPEFLMEYMSDPERVFRAISVDMFWKGFVCASVLFCVGSLIDEARAYLRKKRLLIQRQNEEKDNGKQ